MPQIKSANIPVDYTLNDENIQEPTGSQQVNYRLSPFAVPQADRVQRGDASDSSGEYAEDAVELKRVAAQEAVRDVTEHRTAVEGGRYHPQPFGWTSDHFEAPQMKSRQDFTLRMLQRQATKEMKDLDKYRALQESKSSAS